MEMVEEPDLPNTISQRDEIMTQTTRSPRRRQSCVTCKEKNVYEVPYKKRMPGFLHQVQNIIEEDHVQSVRQLAVNLKASESTVRGTVQLH